MDAREAALEIMKADMATGRATKRSLGVMYAHVMAGSPCDGPDFWGPINAAILEYSARKQPSTHGRQFLDGVKKVAWSIFEEAGRDETDEPTNEVGAVAKPEGRSA